MSVFEDAQALVDDLYSQAEDAANELKSLATGAIDWFSFAARQDYTPGKAELEGVGALPVMTTVASPGDLAEYLKQNPDRFKTHVWESTFFDDLESTITTFIENGGTGINATVQNAIFEQGYDRRRRMLKDNLRDVFAGAGARGWLLPRDMEVAARNDLMDKFDMDYNDANLKTVQIVAERAQQNVQWAMEHGISIENIHQSFAINYAKLYFDITNNILRAFEVEVQQRIAEYDGQLRGRAQEIEKARISAGLDQAAIEREMKKWEIDLQENSERGKSYIAQTLDRTKIRLDAVKSLTDYFRTAVSGVAGMVNAIETTEA